MAARVLAVLAALFLVVAIGLVALAPIGMTLGQGLVLLDAGLLAWLQRHSLAFAWTWIEMPFLQRPMWLVPAGAGLICAGAAASFTFGRPSPSRRKRS